MADFGTIQLGTPINAGQATQVRRSVSVNVDPTTGDVVVSTRACLCDVTGRALGSPANYIVPLTQLSPSAQSALAVAVGACYDAANAANPTGFPT